MFSKNQSQNLINEFKPTVTIINKPLAQTHSLHPIKPAIDIHQKIYEKLDYFHKSNKIPHLLFHGSSGTGKRTIVNNFLNKIYQEDKNKLKTNVMFVNCAHGKGIKFIREELKFFAKTNIQSNQGILFKTIVLLNADYLTIDAQSALRRCIELFSYNTRFFIIVENKNKLLNPILSRFCEIYVPEYIKDGKIMNLHRHAICANYTIEQNKEWIHEKMLSVLSQPQSTYTHELFIQLSSDLYENGYSCLDVIAWLRLQSKESEQAKQSKQPTVPHIPDIDRAMICMCFDKMKAEYRCEKLMMLYIFDFLFLRSKKDLKCITTI